MSGSPSSTSSNNQGTSVPVVPLLQPSPDHSPSTPTISSEPVSESMNQGSSTDVSTSETATPRLDVNDHGKVYIACKQVSPKWRDLGARLAVLENTLAIIEADYRVDGVERCMSAVIDKWLRRPVGEVADNGVLPTWSNLCVALSPIDRGLAEGIAIEHGCNYISPTVNEVYSKNHVPPAFLPQSCGCGQCNIQGWMTGRECQNMIKCDWGPRLLVVDSSNIINSSDKKVVKFGNILDRQTKLCVDTCKITDHFKSVSVTTWEHLAKEMIDETKFSSMVVKFAAWLGRPFSMLSNIHNLQNLLHTLRVSWFNFGALHYLATQFLSTYSDVMAIWSDYCIHFKEYCCKRNLKGFVNVFFQIEEQNVFVIEVDECYYKFTLADIKSLRKSLSIALDVPAVFLHLVTVRGGSVIIYFYYCYSDYLTRFMSLSSQQLKMIAMIEPHKILSLTDLYNQFQYDKIQRYYEDSSSSTTTELQLLKKQAHVKDIELLKKEAENRLLKDQHEKETDQLESERKEAKAEMMELKDTISKKEELASLKETLEERDKEIEERDKEIEERDKEIEERDKEIMRMREEIKALQQETQLKPPTLRRDGQDDSIGETPLHSASHGGHTEVVQICMSNGASKEAKDEYGNTPLHSASNAGHTEVVEKLLSNGASIEAKNTDGCTPLHSASYAGHTEVVEKLLSNGAPIEAKNNNGTTPLHTASNRGHTEVVQVLLSNGAPLEAKNNYGNTPLHTASNRGRTEVVQSLLSNGASIESKDNYGNTPLHTASNAGHTEVVEKLLSKGASIEAKTNDLQSPLHVAISKGHTDIAMLLIQARANVYGEDKYWQSPVLMATVMSNEEVIKCLMSNGVEKETIDKYLLPSDWTTSLDNGGQIVYTNKITSNELNSHPNFTPSLLPQ